MKLYPFIEGKVFVAPLYYINYVLTNKLTNDKILSKITKQVIIIKKHGGFYGK